MRSLEAENGVSWEEKKWEDVARESRNYSRRPHQYTISVIQGSGVAHGALSQVHD
jgi:hypothetical protein